MDKPADIVARRRGYSSSSDRDSGYVSPSSADESLDAAKSHARAASSQKAVTATSCLLEEDLQRTPTANSSAPVPINELVHELIFKDIIPTDPAICAHDGGLTYGELDRLSTVLSRKLIELGTGPEKIVPLCFEKSMFMPVAMLAVMKAGGASMAIDVSQPETRLRTMVDQVEPEVILCSSSCNTLAHALRPGATIVPVGEETLAGESPVDTASTKAFERRVNPSNTLYIVFTSGSTGTPKGVVITHSNFSSALRYQTSHLGFRRDTRALDFASYAFDAAWYNTLHTLSAGGCLCIPSENDRKNDINGSIQRLRPNFANFTPKVAELLDDASLQQLDLIELAGEAPDARQVARMRQKTSVRFAYGPAECSVLSTVTTEHAISPNIGFGVGICTWIVDTEDPNSLAAHGEIGELWIEGPLVGKGYYKIQAKTAEAFVEDPLWLLQGAHGSAGRRGRLYRTGDLVRREGHELVFAGRKDAQVKIRGQRVELGDVEYHVARNLEQTANAKVVADVLKLQGSPDGTLVVFLKSDEDLSAALLDLDILLAEVLPAYLIPSVYISVESLGLDDIPVTPTGKTDRRRLREIGSTFTSDQLANLNLARRAWKPPDTPTEITLRKLWSQVLQIQLQNIGADDTFLKLGGDSVKAMRLIPIARREGIKLSVADVFSFPMLSDLARHVDENLSTKAESDEHGFVEPFALLKGEQAVARQYVADLCGVPLPDIEDIFPCTPLQAGLIALSARGSVDYVVRQSFELKPEVCLNRLENALGELIQAEPILRTRIVDVAGEGLVQIIVRRALEPVPRVSDEHFQQKRGMCTALAHFSFRTDSPSGKTFLSWTMHHAICDGWSVPLLLDQLERAYSEPPLQPSGQSQTFVKHVSSIDEAQSADFWQHTLEGAEAEPFPKLPTPNFQTKADGEVEHDIRSLRWPKGEVTPSTVIRAAWSLLTAQYTACNDVVYGATVSGRQAAVPGIELMTGPTIATLPVRTVLRPEESVSNLLSRIQKHSIESIGHEQFGLQNIRRASGDAERACDFQSILLIQHADQNSDKESSVFSKGHRVPKYELKDFNPYAVMLECQLQDHGVFTRISFDSRVIEAKQASRMLLQLDRILRQLCSMHNQGVKLAEIETASDQDTKAVLQWNMKAPIPVERSVHNLVAANAQRHPHALAVCAHDGDLTYRELDDLSSRLAFHLAVLDIGPGTIVPLSFEKSRWVPVSMLAVLKTGATFAMIPPSLPKARLHAMLQTVSAKVVLALAENAHLFQMQLVICPRQALTRRLGAQEQLLHRKLPASSMAAVMFTSGSTGNPKAIMLDHRSLATAAFYLGRDCAVNDSTRVFQFASYSFDVSIHETFMALIYGACVCIPSEKDRENNLVGSIDNMRADWACLAPSVAGMLSSEDVPALKTLVFAGEKLTSSHFSKWADKTSVFNWYGPAEASVCSITPVDPLTWNDGGIGSGAAARCWIVSRENPNLLAPIGAAGELVADGPIVMKGYLNDRAKSDAVRLANPPWLPLNEERKSEGRLYRTGDLVRYASNGSVVYVGRKDAQVKIRGQRVELGDIEHHVERELLHTNKASMQVVAEVITPLASNTPMLVAFLRSNGGEGSALDFIRRGLLIGLDDKLADRLPKHMIPSGYVAVDTIPTTPAGKVDRRRLKAVGGTLTVEQLHAMNPHRQTQEPEQVKTPAERQMQKLWASVLNKEASTIARTDSFVQAGGDSIAAMRLVTAARHHGLSISVADVFKAPRLIEMATVSTPIIEDMQSIVEPFSLLEDTEVAQAEIAATLETYPASIVDAYPVAEFQASCIEGALKMPPQQRHCFYLDLPNGYSLEKANVLCESLWNQIEALRTIFVRWRDQYVQVLQTDIRPDIKHLSTSTSTVEQLMAHVLDEDSSQPGALGTPFCRFFVFSRAQRECRLAVRLSHAQFDGTSLLHLMKAVKVIHDEQTVPPTPRFSHFMRHAIDNAEAARSHWSNHLQGSSLTNLETVQHGIDEPGLVEVTRRVSLPQSASGYTAATIFTSACALFLAEASASTDVTFGRVVSGRAMLPVHLRDAVGPCLNIVPVRVRSIDDTAKVIQSVHDQNIDGMPYETSGFKDIVKHCTDWPESTRSFGCVTHFQDLGDAEEEIGGVMRTLKNYQRANGNMPEGGVLRISATPEQDGMLRVDLAANGRFHTHEQLSRWADQLAVHLRLLQG
ncbi:hypothetical protein M409DRAFT_61478 [Zasmidium cellare ATCC 36951]|uniref:Carrier domain-containing protein n=1 Tax=Zasmidium cellare ATCC 36951 TaxID=1080233 RepID=A0A6A6BYP4_ZASCE|nr:uncharacterized protein M409DRAFT_61478 [Zasmidium cellare ATCC 36951]KAF2158639.1 hypothetical protein M409DRAFT_61478 [Zasmidium cellare ATCC 36951]